MKNVFKKVVIFLCLMFVSTVLLCACEKNYYKMLSNNVSEIRYNIFESDDDYVKITYMSGRREEPYVSDGIKNELKDFGVFNLSFKNNVDVEEIAFEAVIDGHTYSGVLEKNPYVLNTYAQDIEVVVGNESKIKITYSVGDIGRSVELTNAMSEWKVDCFDALKQASEELKPFIEKNIVNNKLNAEVYVKIAYDTQNKLKPYFWIVQIINTNGESSQLVVDPINNEVLVKTNAVQ